MGHDQHEGGSTLKGTRSWNGITAAISRTWRLLSASFWFLPTVLTLAALLIAPMLVQVDEWLQATGRSVEWLDWIYGGKLQGARRLMSAIAAAMMAITTVMFSSQTTALTFIGQEYGSRLLRNFLADSRNQFAFGTYISTFVYALMVLRTIHKDPDEAPVPHLAVSFGILLAMAGLGLLIYSMYHISRFLQSSTIINYAAKDLDTTIRRLTGVPDADESRRADWPLADCPGLPLHAPTDGYLQYVKEPRLLKLCQLAGCRIRINLRIGDFVVAGTTIATVSGAVSLDASLRKQIVAGIVLGTQPSIEQDLRYAVNQFVQIALRAASSDRNDVLTANMCVDRMGAALCLLARRLPPPEIRCDEEGIPRLMLQTSGFAEALDTFIRPIREFKDSTPSLTACLLGMAGTVAGSVERKDDREALRQEVQWILAAAKDRIGDGPAWGPIERAYDAACRALVARS
jgi:uncharacterized membrane protein